MQPSQGFSRLQFGPFELDLRTGELARSGRRIPLQEQSFRVLALLLEQGGELVSRGDLRDKLWPEQTYVDFDHGLNNAVNRLRDVLRDSVDKPRYIETLPRRGYRFIGEVKRPELRQRAEVWAGTPCAAVGEAPSGVRARVLDLAHDDESAMNGAP